MEHSMDQDMSNGTMDIISNSDADADKSPASKRKKIDALITNSEEVVIRPAAKDFETLEKSLDKAVSPVPVAVETTQLLLQVPSIFTSAFDRDFVSNSGNADDLFKFYDNLVNEFNSSEAEARSNGGDGEVKRSESVPQKNKNVLKFYDPVDHSVADLDEYYNQIINEDVPERMQLRPIPVTSASKEEIKEETIWIFKELFLDHEEAEVKRKKSDENENDSESDIISISSDSEDGDSDSDDNMLGLFHPEHPDLPGVIPPVMVDVSVGVDEAIIPENEAQLDDAQGDILPVPIPVPAAAAAVLPLPRNAATEVAASDLGLDPPASQSASFFGREPALEFKDDQGSSPDETSNKKMQKYLPKIAKLLELIRNDKLEVPFIFYYRRRFVEPIFNLEDLWSIYKADYHYQIFLERRNNLHKLFQKIKIYQDSRLLTQKQELSGQPAETPIYVVTDKDFEIIQKIKNMEQLESFCIKFSLYQSQDIIAMMKSVEKAEEEFYNVVEHGVEIFTLGRQMKLHTLIEYFGLVRIVSDHSETEKYRARGLDYRIEEPPPQLTELCKKYICPQLPTVEDVLQAAKIIFAIQLAAEHTIRQPVRDGFFQNATINVHLTDKGKEIIGITHPLFPFSYLKDVPVANWKGADFLKLTTAEKDGLVVLDVGENVPWDAVDTKFILDQDHEDSGGTGTGTSSSSSSSTSDRVKQLNFLGGDSFRFAIEKILFPQLRQKMRAKLLDDCKKFILAECSNILFKNMWIRPPKVEFTPDLVVELEVKKGLRVLAITYEQVDDPIDSSPSNSESSFACCIGPDGSPTDDSDYIPLQNLTKYTNAKLESNRNDKAACLATLKDFLRRKRPHIVVIGGVSKKSIMIQHDLQILVRQLHTEDPSKYPIVDVEIRPMEVPQIYAKSQRGKLEFPHHPELLRQAISLGRLLQDPLIEFAQLWTSEYDILSFPFCTMQHQIPKEELLERLYFEFVRCVTRNGVDINRVISQSQSNPRLSKILPFIAGLGVRKAEKLLTSIEELCKNKCLQNRNQLMKVCHLGSAVYENCAGSIKIDTDNNLVDLVGSDPKELLDGTRIHPSDYKWAKSMAIDALEMEEGDPNEGDAVSRVLQNPHRLQYIDLDAFCDALETCGFGNNRFNLYELRSELGDRFRELRPLHAPTPQEFFYMLTKETPETLDVGRISTFQVDGIAWRRDRTLRKDKKASINNATLGAQDEVSGVWLCNTCWMGDFPTQSAVKCHMDEGKCPGYVFGVNGKLKDHPGVSAFVPIMDLPHEAWMDQTDKRKGVLEKKGVTFPCVVMEMQLDKLAVVCSAKEEEVLAADPQFCRENWQFYVKPQKGDENTKSDSETEHEYDED